MKGERQHILDWSAQGLLPGEKLRAAMKLAGVLPTAGDWRQFLDRLLLFAGTVLVAAGVIFFLAYNWQDLGRFAKFGLVESLLVVALALVFWLGLDRPGGKAALLASALFLGALLALTGQTYQTGADTFELFTSWALLILPWVILGRSAPLWLLWLAIANLAVSLYYQTFHGLFGFIFGPERLLWALLGLNTLALMAWEGFAIAGVTWLRERWSARLLMTASGACVTALAVFAVFDWRDAGGWALPAWLAWLAAAYAVYRRRMRDLYALAGGVLSVIIVAACFLGEQLLDHHDAGGFLLIGLVVIGLSAAGGWWLNTIAAEDPS